MRHYGDPLCADCGNTLLEDGYRSETRSSYGHACDGSDAECARRCPVEVPIEVQLPCHMAVKR